MLTNLRAVQLLVQHEGLVDIKKEDGFSALHLAALNNHKCVAEIMIKEVTMFMRILVFTMLQYPDSKHYYESHCFDVWSSQCLIIPQMQPKKSAIFQVKETVQRFNVTTS